MGAAALAPVIAEIRAMGVTGAYAIAAALMARGVPTERGHRFWSSGTARDLLRRLDRLSAAGSLSLQIEIREGPTVAVQEGNLGALLSGRLANEPLRPTASRARFLGGRY